MGLFDRTSKVASLDELRAQWDGCTKCTLRHLEKQADGTKVPVGKVCPGIGKAHAAIMVVGKSPTKNESMVLGTMMADHGGKEIRHWFADLAHVLGLKTNDLYFTNVVKCAATIRDPNKPDFYVSEDGSRVGEPVIPAERCSGYLEEEIALVQPKVIISIGGEALAYFGKRSDLIPQSLDKARGTMLMYRHIPFVACSMPIKITRLAEQNIEEDRRFLTRLDLSGPRAILKPEPPKIVYPTPKSVGEAFGQVDVCKECRLQEKCNVRVFGTGYLKSPLMLVGEAPGADENACGAPFVGRAGEFFFRRIVPHVKVRPNSPLGVSMAGQTVFNTRSVYLTNAIKCWPGPGPGNKGNATPSNEQIEQCSRHLQNQMRLGQPRVVVCMGRASIQSILGNYNVTAARKIGNPINKLWGSKVVVTWHPAYVLRQQDIYDKENKDTNLPLCQAAIELIQDLERAVELATC